MENTLRSWSWLQDDGKNGFIARHHLRAMGLTQRDLDGRPVIGIGSTYSELTPCNAHLRPLVEAVRRGVTQAGGVALEFPLMSLGEPLMRPTTMFYRNLAAMETEELIRANPLDAVVLLTGCDKTTPAALMGAASAGVPAIVFPGGAMMSGNYRGRTVGSGTDVWKMDEDVRAGRATPEDRLELESCLNRSAGHCMTMGTASTMACIAEALGMCLPHSSSLLANDSRRVVLAADSGALAVELAGSDRTPATIMTRAAFENALVVNAALGGSTNAVLHLLALAGRLGVDLSLADFDEVGRRVPVLVDLMPSGRFLMEDFANAGGTPALVGRLAPLLRTDAITVSGETLADSASEVWNDEVIRPLSHPVSPVGEGLAVLTGTLAPRGAVLKVSAASAELLVHEGPALVFDSLADYTTVVDDPGLDVTPDTVLIVRGAGPRGYPGMPEVGNLPLPRRLLDEGVTDMVRLSDARMSGTAFGTCVLHISPEAAAGGPLALVRTGDIVRLDVPNRRLDLLVDETDLAHRPIVGTAPVVGVDRGWTKLYVDTVNQADQGADLDFLRGASDSMASTKAF